MRSYCSNCTRLVYNVQKTSIIVVNHERTKDARVCEASSFDIVKDCKWVVLTNGCKGMQEEARRPLTDGVPTHLPIPCSKTARVYVAHHRGFICASS